MLNDLFEFLWNYLFWIFFADVWLGGFVCALIVVLAVAYYLHTKRERYEVI